MGFCFYYYPPIIRTRYYNPEDMACAWIELKCSKLKENKNDIDSKKKNNKNIDVQNIHVPRAGTRVNVQYICIS